MVNKYHKRASTTVSGVIGTIQKRKGDTYIALNPTTKPKKKKGTKARKISRTTTLAEARKSKHVGTEGEVAYGRKMK